MNTPAPFFLRLSVAAFTCHRTWEGAKIALADHMGR